MTSGSEHLFEELETHGVLLVTDARFPSVAALIVGEPVRGSWWAHLRSHDIFRANCALADHPDVLVAKLISGKVTFIHRVFWPAVVAVGSAREPWQISPLSPLARGLLGRTDKAPVEIDRSLAKGAAELERLLLVFGEQFHSDSGAHARRLESWEHWRRRAAPGLKKITAAAAKTQLEKVVSTLNLQFQARGSLPWQ